MFLDKIRATVVNKIAVLKDINGNNIIPMTVTKAVQDDTGKKLDVILEEQNQQINVLEDSKVNKSSYFVEDFNNIGNNERFLRSGANTPNAPSVGQFTGVRGIWDSNFDFVVGVDISGAFWIRKSKEAWQQIATTEQINVLSNDRGYLTSKPLGEGVNLDTVIENGIYEFNSYSNHPNAPSGILIGTMVVYSSVGCPIQIIYPSYAGETILFRKKHFSEGWGVWQQLATTYTFDDTSPVLLNNWVLRSANWIPRFTVSGKMVNLSMQLTTDSNTVITSGISPYAIPANIPKPRETSYEKTILSSAGVRLSYDVLTNGQIRLFPLSQSDLSNVGIIQIDITYGTE